EPRTALHQETHGARYLGSVHKGSESGPPGNAKTLSRSPAIGSALRDVLVIGGSGLLGQHLMREASTRGYRAHGTYSSDPVPHLLKLDLGDSAAIREVVSFVKPAIVAIAAAMTNVDGCESRPELAERVNGIAPGEIAKASRDVGARVVHFSTDYVFDGRSPSSFAPHVARVAFDLTEREESGVYHVVTKGCMTRFEIGEAVCRAFNLPRTLLKRSTLADAGFVAPRPLTSCLTSKRLERFPHI